MLAKILQILLRPVRGHPWTWLIVASHVHSRKAFGQSLIDKALFKPMRICFIQNILQFTFFQVLNGSGPATSLCETFLYLFFGGSNFEAQIFVSWVLNFVKSEMWVRAFFCNSVL